MSHICRDSRGRTCRLLVPNQASHPKTISRIFVCGEQGNRTLTGFTRNILAGCHYEPILDYSPFCVPRKSRTPTSLDSYSSIFPIKLWRQFWELVRYRTEFFGTTNQRFTVKASNSILPHFTGLTDRLPYGRCGETSRVHRDSNPE